MKINEKNLIAFANSPAPIDKDGWLLKRGEVNKNFQKRWCILKGNLLFYYERKGDKEPVGVIILEGCTIEIAEDEENYAFKVVFHGSGSRTYVLAAENQDDMESWMKCLSTSSYDYMKMMVVELQRQLDDLMEAEKHQKKSDGRSNDVRIIPMAGSPVPPPRQRQVMVNRPTSIDVPIKVGRSKFNLPAGNPPAPKVPRPLNFPSLHESFGDAIRKSRQEWSGSQTDGMLVDVS